jgi:ubiquinone biosynthesis protein UbiJ
MLPIPSFLTALSPQRGLAAPATAAVAATAVAATAINHLLAAESWARAALLRHVGKVARISFDDEQGGGGKLLALSFRVAADGMLEAAGADDLPSVTIHIKPADLPLILQQPDRAFSYVRIDGDAEFANTVSQLSKGLRWDAEYDIERVLGPAFGPIAARRLVGATHGAASGVKRAGQRLAENVAEFLLEEQRMLVRPAAIDAFADDIVRLRDDVERTAKRIARLEQKLSGPALPAAAVTTVTTDITAPGPDIR